MREIKFRGKRVDNGDWIAGSYTEAFGSHFIMPKCYFGTRELDEDEDGNRIISNELAFGGFIKIIPETVGQFTGLKDKNGVDIYEGDKLKCYPGFGCEWEPRYGTVIYKEASFWIDLGGADFVFSDRDEQIEVIGNIHETAS